MEDDQDHFKKLINIHIGGCYVSTEQVVISTVLGSCIAVCMFDQYNRIGGMNHIMLPGRAALGEYNNPAKYAINAMELLINRLMKLGASRYRLEAKIFGGAQMMSALAPGIMVGLRNAEFVIELLQTEKIFISNYSIGGTCARKIFFDTGTGEVFLKKMDSGVYEKRFAAEETEFLRKLQKKIHSGERIVFFE